MKLCNESESVRWVTGHKLIKDIDRVFNKHLRKWVKIETNARRSVLTVGWPIYSSAARRRVSSFTCWFHNRRLVGWFLSWASSDMEEDEKSTASPAGASSSSAVQRRSLSGDGARTTGQMEASMTRPRRRSSRRLTPTHAQLQTNTDHKQGWSLNYPKPAAALKDFDSNNSTSAEEVDTSPGKAEVDQAKERKTSRKFSMLQTVQSSVNLVTNTATSKTVAPPILNRNDTNASFFLPLRNPMKDRLRRLDSCSSWAGSECSQSSLMSTSTACSIPPPLVHSVPHHKDGLSVFLHQFIRKQRV